MAVCATCHGTVGAQDKFCKHCGARLAQRAQQPAGGSASAHATGAGHWETCPDCHGTSFTSCPRCSGDTPSSGAWSGRDPCPVCKGSTRVKCANLECQRGRVWVRDY